LGKLNSVVVKNDTPATRGMVFKVRHLVTVEEVADETPAKVTRRAARPVVTQALTDETPAKAPRRAARSAVTQQLAVEPAAPIAADASAEPAATQKLVDEPAAQADQPAATQKLVDEPAAQADQPAATQKLVDEPAAPAADDDLEVIEGIGPKIAGVLREAGVSSFAELAATDTERLTEILQDANLRLASPETWAEQAGLAAAGDWEGLKQLQERLKGGRRE
jgi:predicted flap endonuclease-1-like 5' DNA nuclease